MTTAAEIQTTNTFELGAPLAPEFELLLAACAADTDRLARILEKPISWETALRLAEHHRIVPALHQALYDRDDVPASIQSALHARFEKNAVKVLRFSAELVRIAGALRECGIEVLAHKGPALGQLLYGDGAMRQFGDLDLLIRAQDLAQAKSELRDLGYERPLTLSPRQEREYLRSGYEYVFALGQERNLLELQWQILPRFYTIDFDLDSLFERSVELTIEGFQLRSLAPSDLMLVLCVHAAKHGWAQLGMLRDITALTRLGVDWKRISREATRLGVRKILAISLRLARELLAAEFPTRLDVLEDRDPLIGNVRLNLASGKDPDVQSLSYFREFVSCRERWQDRVRFWLRLALTPSLGEWESVRLPDWSFPLYRIVRLGRLLKRAFGTRKLAAPRG